MLTFSSKIQYYLFSAPVDMRKSFDGLSALIQNNMELNSLSGDMYVFTNRRRDRIKCMVWDGDGFWIYYKRLEKGTFHISQTQENEYKISSADLLLMLEGIDLKKGKRSVRFRR